MAKNTISELEEQVARARLALAEAKKKKMKMKEADEEGDHSDEVDVKKDDSDKDSDDDSDKDDEKVDEDAEGEAMMKGGAGKEPDVKDTDADDMDAKDFDDAHGEHTKKVVGEDADDADDHEEDDKDEDDSDDETSKEKDEKNEAKKHKKRLHTLLQSYREEEQPPVENGPDPLLGGKRPDGAGEKSVAEGVKVIFDGENLTEGFKKKATTLVEAAITSRVKAETKLIEAAAEKALLTLVEEIEEELMSKTDDYMGYVVSEWLEENKLEAENALKVQIFEGFFDGLKALFLEHNITVPDSKIDILESANSEIEELEGIVNTMTEKLIKADKTILEMKKQDVVSELSEGLAATQVEKLKKLTEGIEAKDIESFKEKVTIIRESYFKDGKTTASTKKADGAKVHTEANTDSQVLKYLAAAKADNE